VRHPQRRQCSAQCRSPAVRCSGVPHHAERRRRVGPRACERCGQHQVRGRPASGQQTLREAAYAATQTIGGSSSQTSRNTLLEVPRCLLWAISCALLWSATSWVVVMDREWSPCPHAGDLTSNERACKIVKAPSNRMPMLRNFRTVHLGTPLGSFVPGITFIKCESVP